MILCYYHPEEGRLVARQKWEEWAKSEDRLVVLAAWARAGLTDEEIAKKIGVSRSTLAEWKKKHESIRNALADNGEIADRKVEHSLFRMTQGFSVPVRKAFKVKRTGYDEQGRKVEHEEIETGEEDVYIKPDIKAITFWLKNKRPQDWKERVEDKISDEDAGRVGMVILTPQKIQELSEIVKEDEPEYDQ